MIEMKVDGMTCESCVTHIKQALENVSGVKSAVVSYPKGTVQLDTEQNTSPEALVAAVTTLGYQVISYKSTAALDKTDNHLHVAVIGSSGARWRPR